MNKKIVVFDTNTYVNHYLGYKPVVDLFYQDKEDGYEIHISSIVEKKGRTPTLKLVWFVKMARCI